MTIDLPAEGVVYCKKYRQQKWKCQRWKNEKIGQIKEELKGGNGSNAAFFYYGI